MKKTLNSFNELRSSALVATIGGTNHAAYAFGEAAGYIGRAVVIGLLVKLL